VTRERDLRVRILAQCTASWLGNVLEAVSFGRGVEVTVAHGEYDNVLQDLSANGSSEDCDILILSPWNRRVLGNCERSASARIADELAFWREAWRVARERKVTKLIQIGYDWVSAGAHGQHLGGRPGGDVALVRELNEALRRALPPDAYFLDLEQVSGTTGRLQFYDPRQYCWTKQPFSQRGLVDLAQQIFAAIRASTTGAKKVLVLDLDNALWGGVVDELGPHGVLFGDGDGAGGEAFLAFQEHVKALARRGVLLAVASKNNMADAREPFDMGRMTLSMPDFAAFEASWESKDVLLRRIADRLGLGLESFVFFDDNPAEREHIRQALPEVEVVDVPEEPAEYARVLQLGGWFETIALTTEDRQRSDLYAVERVRSESRASFGSIDDYLSSLEMRAVIAPLDDADLLRVVQLLGKTNQFNLTSRRHSEAQVRGMLSRAKSIGVTARLRDRFGDYGLVGCLTCGAV
jgi:FkbH-like protein